MNSTVGGVGWVAEPTGRGTLGLLYTCGLTIFLCTYSAVHPNPPALDDSKSKILLRKIENLVGCILAPEFLALQALEDFLGVHKLKRKVCLNNLKLELWSLKQYHFLYMGGFVVQTDPTNKKCFLPKDFLRLIKEEVVEMPIIENEDIDDRSKASWVTKSIALVQVSWFLTQLLARAIKHLPVTTLELYTLSIVICAFVTYISFWQKPFDVQRPVVLRALITEYEWPESVHRMQLRKDSNMSGLSNVEEGFLLVLICAAFAACHLIGWNFSFAGLAEKWLWRAGSVCCFALPIALALASAFPDDLESPIFRPLLVLYGIVRIALLAEVLIGLRAVPAGVYQTVRWSDYFPSFG
ncbi:hypothetical protein K458DRAFT_379424 [Lentithecium fluviatile CBS 122367]|uniref:Uncharacterized protein n=1 Tax=Lentithecium fluviatile CBS 122367 TaxID=1168545 RepID=A0A6G1IF46_9PLEO|nr:hypothetical protein K458DRAFT_379424 [Lentithecium fluviatile CBS 122367]